MKQKSITFSKSIQEVLDKSNGRAVLLSIKRQWLNKILSKEKTIEVRKTFPWDAEYPFVVLCYETKSDGGAGKITAAFICNSVDKLDCLTTLPTLSNEKAMTYDSPQYFLSFLRFRDAACLVLGKRTGHSWYSDGAHTQGLQLLTL